MNIYVYQWLFEKGKIIGFGYSQDSLRERVALIIPNILTSFYVEVSKYPSDLVLDCKSNVCSMGLLRQFHLPKKSFYKLGFKSYEDRQKAANLLTYKHKVTVYNNKTDAVALFLSKYKLDHTGWVEVSSYDIKAQHFTICENEYTIEKIKKTNYNPLVLTTLSIDIETYSHDHITFPTPHDYRNTISVISMEICKNNKKCMHLLYLSRHKIESTDSIIYYSYTSEKELISDFFNLIAFLDPDVIIGYNTYSFDYQYIIRRAQLFELSFDGIGLLKKDKVKFTELDSVAKLWGGSALFCIEISGRLNIDLLQFVIKQIPNMPDKKLKTMALTYLKQQKIDLPIRKMFECLKEDSMESISKVLEYCAVDSELVTDLYIKLNVEITTIELANICYMSMETYYTTGSTAKFRLNLYGLCQSQELCLEYQTSISPANKGGLVFEPIIGIHDYVSILDFNSLYPSIIIAYNLCYTTYVGKNINSVDDSCHKIEIEKNTYYFRKSPQGIIPKLCHDLLEARKAIKKQLKQETDPMQKIILNARQNTMKVTANSIYGVFGSGYKSETTFREASECVTFLGRRHIEETRDILSAKYPIHVKAGDTDSVMFAFTNRDEFDDEEEFIKYCVKTSSEMCTSVDLVKNWICPIAIKHESFFKSMIFTAKKRYAGMMIFPDNDDLYLKGSMKGDSSSVSKEIYKRTLRMILTKCSEQDLEKFLVDKIDNLKQAPFEDFIIKKKVKKFYNSETYSLNRFRINMTLKNYTIPSGVPVDIIVTNNGKKLIGDRMMLADHAVLTDIDYNYYINKQILSLIKKEIGHFSPNLHLKLMSRYS